MNSTFRLQHVHEPLLEFGGEARHVDVRFGLMEHGPVDFTMERTKTISLAVVGSARTADGFREWLARSEGGFPAKESKQPNLFVNFPGSGITGPFRCWFEVEDRCTRVIPASRITEIATEQRDDVAVELAVKSFIEEIKELAEQDRPPQVVICALPVELIERVKNLKKQDAEASEEDQGGADEESEDQDVGLVKDFRGALKAAAMSLRIPIQIVWPTTYDNSAVIKRELAVLSDRKVQDEATRAWNLFCAIYYKAGGTPWRMPRHSRGFDTCYLGISFFEDLGRKSLRTSSAQLFDERGEGLILKGGRALQDKVDRHPYLSRDDAHALMRRSLTAYKKEHGNYPARIVVHKSSRFHDDELEGLGEALNDVELDQADFVWLPGKSPVRLVRPGDYPPLRGTAMRIDDEVALLYTRGSVDFFSTYPGLYVPNPLMLHCQRRDRTDWDTLLRETLALTKMNWNNTQFDGGVPITMRAARQVGEILRYFPDNCDIEPDPRYRFYM